MKNLFFLSLNRTFAPRMSCLEPFKIDLKGLSDGLSLLELSLDNAYFEAIDAPEVKDGEVAASLEIKRSGDIFTLKGHLEGFVMVPCDLCLDDMEQPVATDCRFTIKFSEEESEDDELLTVSEDDGVLDLSWLLYEQIALAIPIKHVHAPGKCNVAMTQKLSELSAARSSDEEDDAAGKDIDPRWSALKNLKI